MKKNKETLREAREYAFLLLKFRRRSCHEIYTRLKKKKFDEQIIRETLEFLKEKNFLNDADFAHAWVAERLNKPLGLRRIMQELKIKGIDSQIIGRIEKEIKEDYSEGDLVRKMVKERLSRLGDIESQTAKRRTYAWCLRRGFSPAIVADIINELCTQTS